MYCIKGEYFSFVKNSKDYSLHTFVLRLQISLPEFKMYDVGFLAVKKTIKCT